MATSPRLSFKGYNLGVALSRNKDYIKSIVALFGTINVVTMDWKVFLLTLLGMGVSLVGKLLIDATDYFFTEVEL
jgi:hypothetical protein